MRVIYMGTPLFAVNALSAIVEAGHEVIAVFTQPDKPKGRGKTLLPPEVKVKALEYNIPVYQPEKIREEENVSLIKDLNPEVIVVAAFGQILPESILNIPKYGCINIHASLLPKYRGAAPIEWSIIDGEKETGITTMYMAKGLDTGDMIDKVSIEIADDDTGETLRNKLADLGAKLIIETLDKVIAGNVTATPQKDEESCYAKMLSKEMGKLNFEKTATENERLIRGLQPWPCAYITIEGKSLKIYGAKCVEGTGKPGEIIEVTKKNFKIACKEGALLITKVQPEGKKCMDASAYLNGNKLAVGTMAE